MSEQDPLKQSRLGLRGVLLVSGGVLLASSVFLLPNLGLLQGPTPTTSLSGAAAAAAQASADELTENPSQGADAGASSPVAPELSPVYWLGEVDGSERLFREFLTGQDPAPADPIAEAVRLMTAGKPLDPDYTSSWAEATSVSSSISTQNVITLDISSDAVVGPLPEDRARLAVQQLVYTATAAASNAGLIAGGESSSVVVLIDGEAGYRAFDAIDLGGEWTRDSTLPAPVWIIDPQQDVEVEGVLRIHGVTQTTAQAVNWRIDRLDDGATPGTTETDGAFRTGSADVEAGQGSSGTYSFSEFLPAGRYTIAVSSPAAGSTAADTKTVVVR